MIKVTVFKKDNSFVGLKSVGHAGYADKGQDIVCSAASVLLINTVNSIETLTHDEISYKNISSGDLEVSFPKGLSDSGNLLMNSLILGLNEIKNEYGETYFTLSVKEV